MPELAEVLREHWGEYTSRYAPSSEQYKIANAIMKCRTAELGGHLLACNSCGKREISYNSCRNRHCPKCQGSAQAKWVAARSADLLPVGYFHTVFTVPSAFHPFVQSAPRVMYEILFQAVSSTLRMVSKNNLECQTGAICILHTWGSALTLHPHIHCLIPGAGITKDGGTKRFKSSRYFAPDKVLSKVFEGKFIALFKESYRESKFDFHFDDIDAYLNKMNPKKWVVKTKPPFAGPQTVLKYLARYTHRVAISNRRILSTKKARVTFSYKDYRAGGTEKNMTLTSLEFIRRFFQHTLPHHFVRIRHYGFLARQNKQKALATLRKTLGSSSIPEDTLTNHHSRTCSHCEKGEFIVICEISPVSYSGFIHPPPQVH